MKSSPLIGAALHSCQLSAMKDFVFTLPALEIENFLFPGFSDSEFLMDESICKDLHGYPGKLLVSGPYIDLNPGSPEKLVSEACHYRFRQALDFSIKIGAEEIIFLSTFLPFIYISAYEEDWCQRSAKFWKKFLKENSPPLKISIGNTFEFNPRYLLQLVESVEQPNFRLAFDIGHYLVYGQIGLEEWLRQISPFCKTVYMHSNDGKADTHAEPYQGRLTKEMVKTIFYYLGSDAVWLIKSHAKDNLEKSYQWLQRCMEE